MYDYDKVTPRRGTGCVKWDHIPEGFTAEDMKDVIPMWVADMDFSTAPCVMEAIQDKISQLIFGYTEIQDGFYDAIIRWFGRRHRWNISRDSIIPIAGLVPGGSVAIRALTQPGDEVIVQTPAYNCFFSSVRNLECRFSENKLVYRDGAYTIDFEDFEERCKTAKAFLLCNPQNPAGRLWTRDELSRMAEICLRNGVKIISDEIHCDIVPPGSEYTPMASLSEEVRQNCISLVSPTKCFNLAGLMVSAMVCENPEIRAAIDKVINTWEHCDLNQIGVAALPAAFSEEGERWLDGLNAYIHENFLYMKEQVSTKLPELTLVELEATYLSWLDCSAVGIPTPEIKNSLIRNEKVWINDGVMYGGPQFMRINLACPKPLLVEGVERMTKGLRRLLDCK